MMVQICRAATGPTACYAERELKRYLRKYSGAAFGEGAELTFRLELQKTMLYSWVEFDGNMYVQQNSCGGIQSAAGVLPAGERRRFHPRHLL